MKSLIQFIEFISLPVIGITSRSIGTNSEDLFNIMLHCYFQLETVSLLFAARRYRDSIVEMRSARRAMALNSAVKNGLNTIELKGALNVI